MAIYGDKGPKVDAKTVAEYTVRMLQRTVPPAVPGIMFLSGGQTEEEAAVHLNEMVKLPTKRPWSLSYSYGRALQKSALQAWGGKTENVAAGQKAFLDKALACSKASLGKL